LKFDNSNGTAAIYGYGKKSITISGNNSSRILFTIGSNQLLLTNLRILHGSSERGGGMFLNSGTRIRLANVTISNCTATSADGGGIYGNGAQIDIRNSRIVNNV